MTYKSPFASRDAEIARLHIRIQEARNQKILEPFTEAFKEALGTVAAYTPREQWSPQIEIAYQHAARQIPTGAAIWLDMHGGIPRI